MTELLKKIMTAGTEEETREAIEEARVAMVPEDEILKTLEARAAEIIEKKELANKFGDEDSLQPDFTEEEISIVEDGCYMATITKACPSKDKSVVRLTFKIGREYVEQTVRSEWYPKAVRSVNSALGKSFRTFKAMVVEVKDQKLEIPVKVKTNRSWTNVYFLDEVVITSFEEKTTFVEEDEW